MGKSRFKRFWEKVDISVGCWEWRARRNDKGYGQFWWGTDRKMVGAHRASLMLKGCDLGGMLVCHTCDNPACVRPDHLYVGTNQDNMSDMVTKGRSPRSFGESNGKCKLTDSQVDDIRERYVAPGTTLQNLADMFGVSRSQVFNIVHRKQR